MSSSETMQSILVRDVQIKDPAAMDLAVRKFFEDNNWEFNHTTSTPCKCCGGTTEVDAEVIEITETAVKFIGGDSENPEELAQTYSDWDETASKIIADHMLTGLIVLMFMWEQENVTFHVIEPGHVTVMTAEEVAARYLSNFSMFRAPPPPADRTLSF